MSAKVIEMSWGGLEWIKKRREKVLLTPFKAVYLKTENEIISTIFSAGIRKKKSRKAGTAGSSAEPGSSSR